jgi:hypothetical protein
MDLWPFWLEEAIEAAVAASEYAARIAPLVEQLGAGDGGAEVDKLMKPEALRAKPRA